MKQTLRKESKYSPTRTQVLSRKELKSIAKKDKDRPTLLIFAIFVIAFVLLGGVRILALWNYVQDNFVPESGASFFQGIIKLFSTIL